MRIIGNHMPDELFTELDQLCAPLKAIGIYLFDYVRAFDNGKRICLCNQPAWLEHFYARGFHQMGTFEGSYSLYPAGYVLFETLPFQEVFQEARESYNIDYGITITKPAKNFCEFFFFASTPTKPQIINFYVNNIDLLDRFILYFRDKGSKLIEKAEKHAMHLPTRDAKIITTELHDSLITSSEDANLRESFINDTDIKNYYLYSGETKIKLSKCEMNCALLSMEGNSASGIAKKLFRSERTVENHLSNVKNKFECHSKSDLIMKLLKNQFLFARSSTNYQ